MNNIHDNTNDPVIWLYVICYNEERILPYFLKYYSEHVDKIILFDNQSTDRTRAIAENCQNVEVRSLNTSGKFSELALMETRNTCWRDATSDFCIVCDADEFLYFNGGSLKEFIRSCTGYDVYVPVGFDMVSRIFPTFDESYLWDKIKNGAISPGFLKPVLFNRRSIMAMNFAPGSHSDKPKRIDRRRHRIYNSLSHGYKLRLLHYKYIGLDLLYEKHVKDRRSRMIASEFEQHKFGAHYLEAKENLEAIFLFLEKKSINVFQSNFPIMYQWRYRMEFIFGYKALRERYFVPLREWTRPLRRKIRNFIKV